MEFFKEKIGFLDSTINGFSIIEFEDISMLF